MTSRWSCEYVRTLGLPPSWIEWHDQTSTRCNGECVEPQDDADPFAGIVDVEVNDGWDH